MNLFDLIEAGLGHPDPTMQIAARFGQGPGQPGSPAGAQPLAPPPGAPAGAAPGGGPAPAPPTGAGPPGGPGAAPGGPQQQQGQQQAPPQPAAYTSPPDLVQMYATLAQRQQANEQFNRGLAGLTAAFSPMSQRNAIMHEWDNMTQDPGSLFSNIMALQNAQYQNQQRQALAAAAPGLAKQLNVDLPTAQAIIASGKYGDVESTLAGVSGDPTMQQMRTDQRQFIATHTDPNTGRLTEPVPDYLTNLEKYKAQMQFESTTAQGKAKDQLSAKQDFSTQNTSFNQAEGLLNNLLKDGTPLDEVTKTLIPSTGVGGVIKSTFGQLSDAGGQAASDLQQLKNIVYSKAFQSTGSRRTQQEVSRLSDALSQLDNTNLTPQQLKDQLIQIQGMTRQAHANAYGAAGQVAPDDYYNIMDPIYKGAAGGQPAGDLYAGATGGGKGGFVGAPAAAPAPAPTSTRILKYNPATGNLE